MKSPHTSDKNRTKKKTDKLIVFSMWVGGFFPEKNTSKNNFGSNY